MLAGLAIVFPSAGKYVEVSISYMTLTNVRGYKNHDETNLRLAKTKGMKVELSSRKGQLGARIKLRLLSRKWKNQKLLPLKVHEKLPRRTKLLIPVLRFLLKR